MFDRIFQALFSYSPYVFSQGDFRFDPTSPSSLGATLLVGVVATGAVLTYKRVRVNEGRVRDRVVLTTLRLLALAVVLFCLFRPTLVVRAAVDQQNVVAVVLDDSRSRGASTSVPSSAPMGRCTSRCRTSSWSGCSGSLQQPPAPARPRT
jgi:hypothetical protein